MEGDLDQLRAELERAGDEFYRMITAWTISQHETGTGTQCYQLALIYDTSIAQYVKLLESSAPTWQVLRERQAANELKSILLKDITHLSEFRLG